MESFVEGALEQEVTLTTPEYRPLTIAITADLHYGSRHSNGHQSTLKLVADLVEQPPDLLILAGDIGTRDDFARCLKLFEKLPCRKALVPGNHDVWVEFDDRRGDSWKLYDERLPRISADHGFHYLDRGPMLLPEADLAIVGSMNWYDYTWAIEALRAEVPDWEERVQNKRFRRGMHNDANFVRWSFTDTTFTEHVVEAFSQQLEAVSTNHIIVVTHHPTFRQLNHPMQSPPEMDDLLWLAFSGNEGLEDAITNHARRIRYAFCGHTHYALKGDWLGIHGYNIGGDYHFKRLLRLEWPSGMIAAKEFRIGEDSG